MFDGPLHQIKYVYANHPYDSNGDGGLNAVLEERWAANYQDDGVMVTRVEMLANTYDPTTGYSEGFWTRQETRGDGAIRTISYFNHDSGAGQMYVDSVTDYTNNPNQIERRLYDSRPAISTQRPSQSRICAGIRPRRHSSRFWGTLRNRHIPILSTVPGPILIQPIPITWPRPKMSC